MEPKQIKKLLMQLGFASKEGTGEILRKEYGGYGLEVDTQRRTIDYGEKIKMGSRRTTNFSQDENFVVLECVDRLLTKGYKPENIELEKVYPSGHGHSGELDVCVNREDGTEYLLIECKTFGKEFDKAFAKMREDGGQLFTYFKFSNKADVIMLYASQWEGSKIVYRNEIVRIENDYRTGDVHDFYERWDKLTKDNGIFDEWSTPYNFKTKALKHTDLRDIRLEDSQFIFIRFLEILRHNVVSDKPNAFNKIFTLFLCKIFDERERMDKDDDLHFQWRDDDDHVSFQLRLTDLYKDGMKAFLEKTVSDFSVEDFDRQYAMIPEKSRKAIKEQINRLRLEKNNEFAIKEVFDKRSFDENAVVVKAIVELLQKFKIRYAERQQYLSDFFELLLTTGLKQEAGQFFTPVPIAQFVLRSLPIDDVVKSKLHEGKRDDLLPYIMDYAAGSGHFLTESMHIIQRLIAETNISALKDEAKRKVKAWMQDPFDWALMYIYGVEKDYRLVKVGKVGCYLHGDGLANVIHSDGLSAFRHEDFKEKLAIYDEQFPKENKQFDVVVSNPPYSVSTFKNAAKNYYGKDDFELYELLTENSSEIECLFVERTKQLLKNGGVAGIILPSSILSNGGIYGKAREMILRYFEVIAVTELGSNTFMATGTNTVILFLRRRDNYDGINLQNRIDRFLTDFLDVTMTGVEKPIAKYVNHVWEGLTFEDYVTILKKNPNKAASNHALYKEYRQKIKAKDDKEFWDKVVDLEKDKLFYFILAFPQKVVLVKSGSRDEEKRFLGYEFSNRRGSEGIHPIQRGKSIDECTQLFDAGVTTFDNPEKASTYIYRAFRRVRKPYEDEPELTVPDNLKKHVFELDLVDMMTFDWATFDKRVSLVVKKKVDIKNQWEIVRLKQLVEIVRGASPRPIKQFVTDDPDGINWIKIGDTKPESKYITDTKEKITPDGAAKSRSVNIGDFVLSNSMSFGRPYILNINGCIHDGWLLMTNFNGKLDKDYFYYILSADLVQKQFAMAASGGTSVDNLNIEKVSHIHIPLPPLDVQRKIAAEIEKIERKEKETKEKIESLETRISSVWNETYQSATAHLTKLSDVLTLEYGKGLPERNRIAGKYPVMGSNGIVGYHNEYLISGPAIIVGRKGSAGKVTVLQENCYPIDTTYFVVIHSEQLLFDYCSRLFKHIEPEFIALRSGLGPGGLNRNESYNIKLPVPPLSEQRKIVAKIERLEAEIAEWQTKLKSIAEQKNAVLKKYL